MELNYRRSGIFSKESAKRMTNPDRYCIVPVYQNFNYFLSKGECYHAERT